MVNWRVVLAKVTKSDRETELWTSVTSLVYSIKIRKFSEALVVTGDPTSFPLCPHTYDDPLDTLKVQGAVCLPYLL